MRNIYWLTRLKSVHFAHFSPHSEEWLLWRFSITLLLSLAFVSRLETFSYYVVVAIVSIFILVGTVSEFSLCKSFDICVELNLFARHIALVKSRSKLYNLFSLSFSDADNFFSSTGRSLNWRFHSDKSTFRGDRIFNLYSDLTKLEKRFQDFLNDARIFRLGKP